MIVSRCRSGRFDYDFFRSNTHPAGIRHRVPRRSDVPGAGVSAQFVVVLWLPVSADRLLDILSPEYQDGVQAVLRSGARRCAFGNRPTYDRRRLVTKDKRSTNVTIGVPPGHPKIAQRFNAGLRR